MYSKTGCRGAISAKDNGAPAGTPAKSPVRRLRKQVMDGLAARREGAFDSDLDTSEYLWEEHPDWPQSGVGRWGKKQCLAALEIMGIEPKLDPPRTRYERILDDDWL
jgi:hypothetical protein